MRPSILAALLIGIVSTSVMADSAPELKAVREAVSRNLPDTNIASVTATPIPNIFEVVANQEVIYVDHSGRYAFLDGRLVDVINHKDLTQPTLDRLAQIDFKKLPKELAIKRVNGNGRRELAVFADPACPMCRRLDADLAELADATIYIYTLPIVSPESAPASLSIWCAPANQRLARWESFMSAEGPLPKMQVPKGCDNAQATLQKIAAFGDRHQIHNTPTIVLPNSKRIVGAMPIADLDTALNEAYRSVP